ncbi:MAG: hypothetical protein MJ237_05770 [bacterium]|nr:hypothetical protein [bacterium]
MTKKTIITVLIATVLALVAGVAIYNSKSSNNETYIEENQAENVQTEYTDETINTEENTAKDNVKVVTEEKEIPKIVNFIKKKKTIKQDVPQKKITTEDVKLEETLGDMLKNGKIKGEDVPKTAPRSEVVDVQTEYKLQSPHKYFFK